MNEVIDTTGAWVPNIIEHNEDFLKGVEFGRNNPIIPDNGNNLRADCIDRALRLQVQPDKILEYAEKFYEFVTKK